MAQWSLHSKSRGVGNLYESYSFIINAQMIEIAQISNQLFLQTVAKRVQISDYRYTRISPNDWFRNWEFCIASRTWLRGSKWRSENWGLFAILRYLTNKLIMIHDARDKYFEERYHKIFFEKFPALTSQIYVSRGMNFDLCHHAKCWKSWSICLQ
jgi:hypothetical protein